MKRWLVAPALLLTVCSRGDLGGPATAPGSITLTSPAFADGEPIPERFTCEGEDVSPPLEWSGVPEGTAGLALIMDDPDAPGGTFTHWVIFGLDAGLTRLEEGADPGGAVQGMTSFGEVGYGGPCPPPGDPPHTYVFELHALSAHVDLAEGAAIEQVRAAVAEASLGAGRLTGTYGR
ncbi:MAG: YbhB/YbcL family Raf kinase inhibitor-like protein [Acidimicrobiia bacterium]